jgi:RNA polymerase sigma-70 factor (ECF subfamily)
MTENDKIKRLLAAIELNNDKSAYKELFILLYARLKQFAFSILRSGEEAEELVSDVFIKIWQRRSQLGSIESPLLYFYTTAKNLALNRLKKQNRLKNINPDEWLVQLNSIYFDPERRLLNAEMARQLRDAIDDLPPRCRLIFKLVKEDGLKYKETAELLQLSVKTIEAQMAIALRRLTKSLDLTTNALESVKEHLKK